VEGPHRVKELLLGNSQNYANVPFERDDNGKLKVCLEASHSAPRIIYRADHSGKAITEHIVQAALSHPLINIVTDTIVSDLILSNNVCIGATLFHKLTKTHSSIFTHVGVTLASGGLAGVYTHVRASLFIVAILDVGETVDRLFRLRCLSSKWIGSLIPPCLRPEHKTVDGKNGPNTRLPFMFL